MQKFVKFLLCLGFCLIIFEKSVSASSNPYPKTQTIEGITTISCTYFAWQEAYEKLGVELPRWGNAGNWYERALKNGYKVGSEAKPNSIAVWKDNNSIYGHVAYVVAVNGDNMLVNEGGITTIIRNQETNEIEKIPYNGNGIFYNNNMPISKKRNEFTYLLGFIYLIDEEKISRNNSFEESNNEITTKDVLPSFEIKEEKEEIKKEITNKKIKTKIQEKNNVKEEVKENVESSLKIDNTKLEKTVKITNEILKIKNKYLSMLRNLIFTIFSLFLIFFK